MGVKYRVTKNSIPSFIQELNDGAQKAAHSTALDIRDYWSRDVRVSVGDGNYDGASGGSPGHYRDNIFVRGVNQNAYDVWTPVPYWEFNEYGSYNLSPRPSMQRAIDRAYEEIGVAMPGV